MKKLFGIIIIISLFSTLAYAGTRLIKRDLLSDESIAIRTICTDGYKFVTVRSIDVRGIPGAGGIATALSIVQFYENKNGNAVPAKC